jgi:hypothetical protein
MKIVLSSFFVACCAIFLFSCGAGTETTGASVLTSDQDACGCLVEMNAAFEGLISDENNATWTAKEWTDAVTQKTSPCMVIERTPEELSAWSAEQSQCEEYAQYSSLVSVFRERLIAARVNQREVPQDIRDLSEGGAKGLLDQLSKRNQ